MWPMMQFTLRKETILKGRLPLCVQFRASASKVLDLAGDAKLECAVYGKNLWYDDVGCFVAGTIIPTRDGEKNIEDNRTNESWAVDER